MLYLKDILRKDTNLFRIDIKRLKDVAKNSRCSLRLYCPKTGIFKLIKLEAVIRLGIPDEKSYPRFQPIGAAFYYGKLL